MWCPWSRGGHNHRGILGPLVCGDLDCDIVCTGRDGSVACLRRRGLLSPSSVGKPLTDKLFAHAEFCSDLCHLNHSWLLLKCELQLQTLSGVHVQRGLLLALSVGNDPCGQLSRNSLSHLTTDPLSSPFHNSSFTATVPIGTG